jgi:hypothetical protein
MSVIIRHKSYEDGANSILHFALTTSRNEPPLKRADIIMMASGLDRDAAIKQECCALSNELMDVEQICQKYLADIRDSNAAFLVKDELAFYLLDRIEEQSLEAKLDLFNVLAELGIETDHRKWAVVSDEVTRFEQRFENFLFKIRTRFYRGSNREAVAEEAAREKARAVITQAA